MSLQETIYNMLQNDGENAEQMMTDYSLDELLEVYGEYIK